MIRKIINEGGYLKISYPHLSDHNENIKALFKQDDPGSLGKYLIFSDNKEDLIKLGEIVCLHFDLSEYWISNEDKDSGIFSYVCKIYDTSDRFSRVIPTIINKHKFAYNVEYRYWKLERASRNGIYSKEYLSNV
jgi:hypothetical protein